MVGGVDNSPKSMEAALSSNFQSALDAAQGQSPKQLVADKLHSLATNSEAAKIAAPEGKFTREGLEKLSNMSQADNPKLADSINTARVLLDKGQSNDANVQKLEAGIAGKFKDLTDVTAVEPIKDDTGRTIGTKEVPSIPSVEDLKSDSYAEKINWPFPW